MKKRIISKKYVALTLAMLLCMPSLALSEEKKAEPAIPTDKEIMALQDSSTLMTVNNVNIPKWMYDNSLRDALKKAKKNKNDAIDENAVKVEVLQNLIDMELLEQEAKKEGFGVNEAGGHLRSSIVSARYKKEGEFRRILAAAGMTEKQYGLIWQQQASVNQLLNSHILDKVEVSEEELKALYEKEKHTYARKPHIQASHILITVAKDATPEVKAEAKKNIDALHKQVTEGGDFAALAKEHSQDGSAQIGGNLGFFSREEMVKPFATAAFALKTGEISPVVETKFGYHIIKKTAEQDAIPSFEEMQNELARKLKNEKGQNAFKKYKEELFQKAEINFKNKELEKIYDAR